jgi:hypothetical protein
MNAIERLISDAASRGGVESFAEFRQLMFGKELYFNFSEKSIDRVVGRICCWVNCQTGFGE